MRARSMVRAARSPVLQSQATANLPGPSGRATSFQPVPWHDWQFSRGIVGSIRACVADGKRWAVWNAVEEKKQCGLPQRHRERRKLERFGKWKQKMRNGKRRKHRRGIALPRKLGQAGTQRAAPL